MKKTVASVVIRMLSILIQLIYVKYYTRYLTVSQLGYSFYLTTLSYAVNALILVPADFYQQASLVSYYDGVFPLGSIVALNKRLLLTAGAISMILGLPIYMAGKVSVLDLLLTFALSVFLYVSTLIRSFLNNRGHGLFTGWMLLLEAGMKVLSFLLFIELDMSRISAFILSTIVAFFIEVIGLTIFFYRMIPFTLTLTSAMDFTSMLKASSSISFSAICNCLQLQGYRIAYVWMGFPEVAGLYAAVSNLGSLGMTACATVFSQTLLPRVYSSKGTYITTYLRHALVLCVGILLVYLFFGRVLLLVLTKREFEPYTGLMFFGIFVEAGSLMIGSASSYFTIHHRSNLLLGATVAGLVTAVGGVSMCLVWHPHNYYWLGAVLACSQGIVCAALCLTIRKLVLHEANSV